MPFISANEFNTPFTDKFGPTEFADFLQAALKHAFVDEAQMVRIFTIFVELKKAEQKVKDEDIQQIADAVVYGGYSLNLVKEKTITDVRVALSDYSSLFGALHKLRSFQGNGSEEIGVMLNDLARNNQALTADNLQQLREQNSDNTRLCGVLNDALRCYGVKPRRVAADEDYSRDVPMTVVVAKGATEATRLVVEMLKMIQQQYSGPHEKKLTALITECETRCNSYADHQNAINKLTSLGGGLGAGRLNTALKEMSKEITSISLGAQTSFDAPKILATFHKKEASGPTSPPMR